jgi:hypothetical protein
METDDRSGNQSMNRVSFVELTERVVPGQDVKILFNLAQIKSVYKLKTTEGDSITEVDDVPVVETYEQVIEMISRAGGVVFP